MNVCFLCTHYPNLFSGGVENVTFRLCAGLSERGHHIVCAMFEEPHNGDTCIFDTLTLDGSNDVGKLSDFIYKHNVEFIVNQSIEHRWMTILQDLKQIFPNLKFLKVHHTDPFWAFKSVTDSEPLYTESESNFRRIIHRYSLKSYLKKILRLKYIRSLYRSWFDFYDKIILLSKSQALEYQRIITPPKNYISKGRGIRIDDKITSIGNPIDISVESCVTKQKTILYVGRLNRDAKRPDRLLAVWKQIYNKFPDWNLVILGEGPLKSQMEKYIMAHNLKNVTLVGQQNPIGYYQKASILCITSTYEGFSLVCIESLMNHVIPIAFDSYSAIGDMIKNGRNGILVKPYSIKAYAKSLATLMSDDELRKRMMYAPENARIRKEFSIDSINSKWENLFTQKTAVE